MDDTAVPQQDPRGDEQRMMNITNKTSFVDD